MDTKTRIINAAERLFAEQGFAQTSMREITTKAEVNLAAVNYHFGNKNNLIHAVFKRYFDQLMPNLDTCLSAMNAQDSVKGVFTQFIEPLQALDHVRPHGCALFLLLLGRGYNETQGHLRRFIQTEYGDTLSTLVLKIHQSAPWLSAETLFWRLHFALGSVVFAMAAQTALSEIAEADFHHTTNTEDMLHTLLPFVAQGISAV